MEGELQNVMERLEEEGATEELRSKRTQVISGLWEGYKKEESKWLQKSRVRWLKRGIKTNHVSIS